MNIGGSNQQPQGINFTDMGKMFDDIDWGAGLPNPSSQPLPNSASEGASSAAPPIPSTKPQLPPKPTRAKPEGAQQQAQPKEAQPKEAQPKEPQTVQAQAVKPQKSPPADRASSTSILTGVHGAFEQKERHPAGAFTPRSSGRVMDSLLSLAKKVGTLVAKAEVQVDKVLGKASDQADKAKQQAKNFFAGIFQKRAGEPQARSLDELAKPPMTPKGMRPPAPSTSPSPPPAPPPPAPPAAKAPPPPPPPPPELSPDLQSKLEPRDADGQFIPPRDLPPPPAPVAAAVIDPSRLEKGKEEDVPVMQREPLPRAAAHDAGERPAAIMHPAAEAVKPQEANPALGGAASQMKSRDVHELLSALKTPGTMLVVKDGELAVFKRPTFAIGARAGTEEALTKLFQQLSRLEPSDMAHLLFEIKNSDWFAAASKNLPPAVKEALASLSSIASPATISIYMQQINEAAGNITAFVAELKQLRDNPNQQADVAALKLRIVALENTIEKAMGMITELSSKLNTSDIKSLPMLRAIQGFRIALSNYAPMFKEQYRKESQTLRDISTDQTNQKLIGLKNQIPDMGIDLSALEAQAQLHGLVDYYKGSQSVYENMQVLVALLPEENQNAMAQITESAKHKAGVAKNNTVSIPEFQAKLNAAKEPAEKQKLFTGAGMNGINQGSGLFSEDVLNDIGKFLANDELFGALLAKIPDGEANKKIIALRQSLIQEQADIKKKQKEIKNNHSEIEVSPMTVHGWKGPEGNHDLNAFHKRFGELAQMVQVAVAPQ